MENACKGSAVFTTTSFGSHFMLPAGFVSASYNTSDLFKLLATTMLNVLFKFTVQYIHPSLIGKG